MKYFISLLFSIVLVFSGVLKVQAQCTSNAIHFSQIPTSYYTPSTLCTITDALSCMPGSVVTTGGGSYLCQIEYNGSSWVVTGFTVPLPTNASGNNNSYTSAACGTGTTVTSTNVGSGGTTLALPSYSNSIQLLTMTAAGTITIPAGNCPGQFVLLQICQDNTGTHGVTIAESGVTLTDCTPPTFITTHNKCGNLGIFYTATNTAYCTGYNPGPL